MSSSSESSVTTPPPDRRTEVVQAAVRAFARGGFGGTTLADVAAEAGVSQPRISQIFGNKEQAFVEAHRYAAGVLVDALRENACVPFDPAVVGQGYFELARTDREALLVLFQGYASSYVPAIADEARLRLAEVLEVLLVTCEATPKQARDFLARGFALHHVMAINLREHLGESPHFETLLESLR